MKTGIEVWVWRDGKKYMCFGCERLFSNPTECQVHVQECAGRIPGVNFLLVKA